MKTTAISMFLLVFGALVLGQAVQQANQYWASGPQVKAQVWTLEQTYTPAMVQAAEAAGVSVPDMNQAKQLMNDTQSIYLQTAVIDAILGLILLFLGVLYYPEEKHAHAY